MLVKRMCLENLDRALINVGSPGPCPISDSDQYLLLNWYDGCFLFPVLTCAPTNSYFCLWIEAMDTSRISKVMYTCLYAIDRAFAVQRAQQRTTSCSIFSIKLTQTGEIHSCSPLSCFSRITASLSDFSSWLCLSFFSPTSDCRLTSICFFPICFTKSFFFYFHLRFLASKSLKPWPLKQLKQWYECILWLKNQSWAHTWHNYSVCAGVVSVLSEDR